MRKWLNYYKKSLSDALVAEIEVDETNPFEIEDFDIDGDTIESARLVEKLFEKQGHLADAANSGQKGKEPLTGITILIAPFKLRPKADHQFIYKSKKSLFPFWYRAVLYQDGSLIVPEEYFPVFQRRYLEPLADQRAEFILGTVADVDSAMSLGREKYWSYESYVGYVRKVFKKATGQVFEEATFEDYDLVRNAILLIPEPEIQAATAIVQHYEHLLAQERVPPLLDALLAADQSQSSQPLLPGQLIDVNALHLGQMGYEFSLSPSQRKALYTLLVSDDKVFPVNGSPGTGKTTLLQSVVANLVVAAAIKGGNPPVMLACSTNNQAVTNIIESFSKSETRPGPLQGRWLPDFEGYATFLPASGKSKEELKGINYKKLSGEGLFEDIENGEYLEKARKQYLAKATAFYGARATGVAETVARLQKDILAIQHTLADVSGQWKKYLKAEVELAQVYAPNPAEQGEYYANQVLSVFPFESDIIALSQLEQTLLAFFKKESFFQKIFCQFSFGFALKNRAAELRILLRQTLLSEINLDRPTKINLLDTLDAKIKLAKSITARIEAWNAYKHKSHFTGNPPRAIGDSDGKGKALGRNLLDELDVGLRHRAFQLAVHYWEGRWLLALEEDLADPKFPAGMGKRVVMRRWKRQAMLTPCFVSTFYMAPKFFSYYAPKSAGSYGTGSKGESLLDFLDLLIVDEAGQVTPEVGVATFSLAQRAVVVGDVQQIEPIWSIGGQVDIGNLRISGILTASDETKALEKLSEAGYLASTGSLMRLAQHASTYREPGFHDRGVTLVEHRRCYDEIIGYCNDLAYNGQLVPMKGNSKHDALFPPMLGIHVEGQSVPHKGSRHNPDEVRAIVQWLILNRQKIEAKYGTKVEEAVGIVTPFAGQKNSLARALKQAGFAADTMKLGTVHALQGAERPIVLFSTVYGPGETGVMFFDRDNKPNMLNVAVSRAKESFIVFANTRILDKKARSPSGLLANHLHYETRPESIIQ